MGVGTGAGAASRRAGWQAGKADRGEETAKTSSKKRRIAAGATAVTLVAALGATGTYSYLHDETDPVTNNFNPNTVTVNLEETKGSTYEIVPGTTVEKDPKVTVTNDVDSYVFVEVKDTTGGLVDYETSDGW